MYAAEWPKEIHWFVSNRKAGDYAMFRFMMQKIIHKKWMVVCLLIGNVLLMAIACSNPMYKSASLQRMLTKQFSDYIVSEGKYPAYVLAESYISRGETGADSYVEMTGLVENLSDTIGFDQTDCVRYMSTPKGSAISVLQREDNKRSHSIKVAALSGLDEHASIIAGRMYNGETVDGIYEAVVSQNMLISNNYILDEVVEFKDKNDASGNPLKVKIVGVFKNSEQKDEYWIKDPSMYESECFISFDLFEKSFVNTDNPSLEIDALWYLFFDYSRIIPSHVEDIIKKTEEISGRYNMRGARVVGEQYLPILKDFRLSEQKSLTTLLVLQVPVFVLLCAFIFMISRQMLELEQNEIALLKSRGAGKKQIIAIYLLQSVILTGISVVIGVPLGIFMCTVLGSANGFLEFVHRSSLRILPDVSVFLYCLLAACISTAVMVLPVMLDSNVSIVNIKHRKNKRRKSLWQKVYLDVILFAVSLYGLYSLNERKDVIMADMLSGKQIDPMLCLCASLFIISGGLVALRIQPLIVRIVYAAGVKFWRPAMFASFLHIIRNGVKQKFMMVFLILTVALGIYNATFARTILSNAGDSIDYANGADVVLQEVWEDNSAYIEWMKRSGNVDEKSENSAVPELVYIEPDSTRFLNIEGVESIARVYKEQINVKKASRDAEDIQTELMAINTKEFGETVEFKESLLPEHINTYLNVLSTRSDAVILSMNFHTKQGYNVGDSFKYTTEDGMEASVIVYGFVEYWPSYLPEVYMVNEDGVLDKKDNYLVLANLASVQELMGVRPYQLWLKMSGSSKAVYAFAEESGTKFTMFKDSEAEKVSVRNDTLFQGTNGILTMSFIVVLILCSVGFLIYWILSIRQRELLFGVFRAMGMKKSRIIQMLINEQIFSSGISVAIGAALGMAASAWFVPIVQICYSAAEQVVPLVVVRKQIDMIRLFGVVGAVICICMVILGLLISKIKISQALKLGED